MRITSVDANLLIISNKEIKYLQFNAIFCGLCFNISLMLTFFWGIAYVICLLHFMESTIALVCTKITSWQTEFYMHLKTFFTGVCLQKVQGLLLSRRNWRPNACSRLSRRYDWYQPSYDSIKWKYRDCFIFGVMWKNFMISFLYAQLLSGEFWGAVALGSSKTLQSFQKTWLMIDLLTPNQENN